ncbi:MAG: ParB/RepB/Spo0J family partition protein [Candidatus Kerfeldbacteria bacterium]|nr:ParB/RepB/Spo0J family partition protein [Candidatus Kerfeldbacteria bacterium]
MATGLGRGLSSLIPQKPVSAPQAQPVFTLSPVSSEMPRSASTTVVDIPIAHIEPNPLQPRQHFDPKNLEDLTESIRRYGLLEPIVVTPLHSADALGGKTQRWQIVAGERRFRAFQRLEKETIPAIIRSTSELEKLELALIENIQRQDLNPMEKAVSLAKLVDEFGLTQEEAAKKIGMARSTLANIIRLLDLPAEIQTGLAMGKITEGHGKVLLGLPTNEERMAVYARMTSGAAMSVKELSESVQATSKKPVRRPVMNYELQQAEDVLQKTLGTKVKISSKNSGVRKIMIETHSSEDFTRVMKQLLRKN